MFRHHHITDQRELITVSDDSQGLDKHVSRPNRTQRRQPAITG